MYEPFVFFNSHCPNELSLLETNGAWLPTQHIHKPNQHTVSNDS